MIILPFFSISNYFHLNRELKKKKKIITQHTQNLENLTDGAYIQGFFFFF